ncbi:MAG: S41 family peptidase [Lachnospiraceae bacterium]|nr:S41 family peptidase [Lachnospiraceae bacterium]
MKNRFITGMIIGIVCSALIFTGVYALSGKMEPQKQNASQEDGTNGDGQDSEDGNNKKGGLLRPSGADLIDDKANYIMRLIDNYFLYGVTQEAYQTAIYRALLYACNDPYSCYYTPEEYNEMMESSSGMYCGIGCLVQQDVNTKLISIVRPFVGSPAEKAGILAGDIVYKVDGEDVSGQDVNLVVSKMKGEENTKVVITMYRSGEYLDFEVTRAFIEVETVTAERIEEGGHKLGLITVLEFDEVTAKQFLASVEDMKKWGAEGLIIDLRDNPGGYVDTAVDMLDPLLPKGLIVYMKDKHGRQEDYNSDSEMFEIPMAVIINERSASASEIFAGAMQDYGVATLVGTQSFGKGIVQSVIPLSDGSAVKMTIADYYTPLGRNIHGVGITPDVIVELPEGKSSSNVERADDTQLAAAVRAVIEKIEK